MLEEAFLYLSRDDVEALQISHRFFDDIISAEGFGKLTPLRPVEVVHLLDDVVAISRKRSATAKRFGYDSEDVVNRLRNTCVDSLDMSAVRALPWFIAHRSMFRVVNIRVELPSANAVLKKAFLRPGPAHHWTSAIIYGDLHGSLPLTCSALENVERLSALGPSLQVTVDDMVQWLHRPVSPSIDTDSRRLNLDFGNIDGELQQLLQAIREVGKLCCTHFCPRFRELYRLA